MTDEDKVRTFLGFSEKRELPSRYWEGEPAEDDILDDEKEQHIDDLTELPFI